MRSGRLSDRADAAGPDALVQRGIIVAPPDLIGREAEHAEIASLLAPGAVITLTGAGGIGKTALAMSVGYLVGRHTRPAIGPSAGAPADPSAEPKTRSKTSTAVGPRADGGADPSARFDDVWFCELGAVFDADSVASAVADDVGAFPNEDASPESALISALRGRSALLILDNVEQVVGATSRFLTRLLAECPGIAVLVTSREVLHVPGERAWVVEPLGVGSAAPRLFVERAVAVDPGFDRAAHVDAVVSVCRALDGIPLALELAAARLGDMTVEELADRLTQGTGVLREAGRVDPQATMAATVRWSYDLLDPVERRLFDRLSVFPGGFDAAGALAVIDPPDRTHDLDALLRSLADKSMLVRSSVDDVVRYELLETIRHFGDRQLAGRGERSSIRNAHLDHVIAVTGTASAMCHGAEWARGLERFSADWDNIRAALSWAIDTQRYGDVDRLLRDLYFMCRWSLETEPGTWAERARERGQALSAPVGAPAALHLAFSRFLAGDHAQALNWNAAALENEPTPSDRSWARHYSAVELLYLGRTGEAAAAADVMVADPPPRAVERAMQSSAHAVFKLYAQQIRVEDAIASIDRSATVAAGTGSPVAIGHVEYNRGLVAFTRGDVDGATKSFGSALDLARAHRIPNLVGYVLTAQVYAPGSVGLRAAKDALEYWGKHRDVANEFVVLEAAGINLAEIGKIEPAAKILGNLEQVPRRLASSTVRREAAMATIGAHRRGAAWMGRGAEMSRAELLRFARDSIATALG